MELTNIIGIVFIKETRVEVRHVHKFGEGTLVESIIDIELAERPTFTENKRKHETKSCRLKFCLNIKYKIHRGLL